MPFSPKPPPKNKSLRTSTPKQRSDNEEIEDWLFVGSVQSILPRSNINKHGNLLSFFKGGVGERNWIH